jgi:hypothetical protein
LAALLLLLAAGQARAAVVLFDQGHGQMFTVENRAPLDLSKLAGIFETAGLEVKVSREALSAGVLKGVAGLVISGPFKPFSRQEIASIEQFVGRGGRLCLMLHIPQPLLPFLSTLGVAHSQAPLNEQENILDGKAKAFAVTALAPHPLTRGLKSFKAYGVWGLKPMADNVRIVAAASPRAWIDLNGNGVLDRQDDLQPHALVVAGTLGQGAFLVFGDDAIFQNQFLLAENLLLARNLAEWLRGAK